MTSPDSRLAWPDFYMFLFSSVCASPKPPQAKCEPTLQCEREKKTKQKTHLSSVFPPCQQLKTSARGVVQLETKARVFVPHGPDIHIRRNVWEDFLQILLPLHKWFSVLTIFRMAYTQLVFRYNLQAFHFGWWTTEILNLCESSYSVMGFYYVRKHSIVVVNQKTKTTRTPESKHVCSQNQNDIWQEAEEGQSKRNQTG